jgi:uncharacterized protein with LGFP repeats
MMTCLSPVGPIACGVQPVAGELAQAAPGALPAKPIAIVAAPSETGVGRLVAVSDGTTPDISSIPLDIAARPLDAFLAEQANQPRLTHKLQQRESRGRFVAMAFEGEDHFRVEECRDWADDMGQAQWFYKNHYSACMVKLFEYQFFRPECPAPPCPSIGRQRFRATILGFGFHQQRSLDWAIFLDDWKPPIGTVNMSAPLRIQVDCNAFGLGNCDQTAGETRPLSQWRAGPSFEQFGSPDFIAPASNDPHPQDQKTWLEYTPVFASPELVQRLEAAPARCDTATYVGGLNGGCIFPRTAGILFMDPSDQPSYSRSLAFIKTAFTNIGALGRGVGLYVPGNFHAAAGQRVPLTRNFYGNRSRNKVRTECQNRYGIDYTTNPAVCESPPCECDEYPFDATYQNANYDTGGTATTYVVKPVNGDHNGNAGRKLLDFLTVDHILDGDPFWVFIKDSGSALGLPITGEIGVPGGTVMYFTGGSCPGAPGPFGSGSAVYDTSINGIGRHTVQGCIFPHYVNGHGGPGGHLGFPTSDEMTIAGGFVSYFDGHLCGTRGPERSGSAIYASAATGVHAVQGCIYKKYWEDPLGGGPAGHLGFPITDEIPLNGGSASYFHGNNCGPDRGPHGEGAAIFAGPGGIHSVQGCIYRKYRLPIAQGGHNGPAGLLGWPTSDEIVLPGGWVSHFQGNACPGVPLQAHDSGSAIFAHGTHVHNVQGCIYTKYMRDHGGATGILGFPVTDELSVNGGWASYFQGTFCGPQPGPGGSGSGIFASGATGVHNVMGCIFTKYMRDHGGPAGLLGFPTSDETVIPGGWVSYFQGNACPGVPLQTHNSGSAIFAHGSHVHNVQGCIYTKYMRDHGGPSGVLGFPVTDEIAVNGGWASYFQGTFCGPQPGPGGSGSGIFASGATGVHNVMGCIFTKYMRDHGGPAGNLGFPTSDEKVIPGGWVSYFGGNACGSWRGPFNSGSAIYAHGSHVHNVQGCIYKKYIEIGGPSSSGLGFPTSDELAGPNGWISHFQNGYIFADGSSIRVFRT